MIHLWSRDTPVEQSYKVFMSYSCPCQIKQFSEELPDEPFRFWWNLQKKTFLLNEMPTGCPCLFASSCIVTSFWTSFIKTLKGHMGGLIWQRMILICLFTISVVLWLTLFWMWKEFRCWEVAKLLPKFVYLNYLPYCILLEFKITKSIKLMHVLIFILKSYSTTQLWFLLVF